jgi:hypothetical protein
VITDITAAIYAQLAPMLVEASLPPLVDGKIVLGRQRLLEASAPPRIIMVPVRSVFSTQDETASTVALGQLEAWLARSLLTDAQHFEVIVWGVAATPDPDLDFNATEKLYKLFIRAVHQISHGAYAMTDGEWLDQRADATQLVKLGHQFSFGVAFETPVQDDSLAFVPAGTTDQETVTIAEEAP